MPELISFAGPDELAESAAAKVAALLARGLAERGAASLVVPGGRTPERFLTRLARQKLDWPQVSVTLSDERWVDETSPDSNAALVRRCLLTSDAAGAFFLPLYTGAPTLEEGLKLVEIALELMPHPWEAVVLGMGEDGHFASLFPGGPGLEIGMRARCVAIAGPAGGLPRLSLTLSCLAETRHILVIASGARKRQVWERAATADPRLLPIAALHRLAAVPVDFLWCP
jgi:6-phosphogluconolactonase